MAISFRNLVSMAVEGPVCAESIDEVALLCCCDKTTAVLVRSAVHCVTMGTTSVVASIACGGSGHLPAETVESITGYPCDFDSGFVFDKVTELADSNYSK